MADSPASLEIEECDIENQRQSSLNSEHANANGCNKAYAFICKHCARLQILVSNISKAILPAAHVENGLLEPDRLMAHKEYGYIRKLLQGLLTIYTLVFTTLAQGPRWHCEHWWIPFSLVLIVSVAVAIAVFCQLKEVSRSARQVCLHPSLTR
jgi:hypothetical protein